MVPKFPFRNFQNHKVKPQVPTPTRVLEETLTLTNKARSFPPSSTSVQFTYFCKRTTLLWATFLLSI